MDPRSVQVLLAESAGARKLLADLGALLGATSSADFKARSEVMPITADKTIRELAVELPHAARIFERLGIDYCCGGQKSLDEACASARLSIDEVVRELEQGAAVPSSTGRDWNAAPLAELVDHIVGTHHTYVRSEVPRIEALISKVAGVHGKNHPELERVRLAFRELANELGAHLMKEEQILFPYVKEMAGGRRGPSCFGTVQNPIRVMMMEHDDAGEKLREMRRLTSDYSLPADACASYASLFKALPEFEQDLHQHIHLENNILFPRAAALEQ